jgi:multidrug transporter EmrE-like cation transporter
MQSIPVFALSTFIVAIMSQIVALGFLPRTVGFHAPVPTLSCVGLFVLSLWLLARLSQSGINLSILIPLVAATVPLGTVAIGIFMYGEGASALKICVLVAACGLIGVAARVP